MSAANTWGNPSNTVGTLNGLFKDTYGDQLKNLIPENVKILNKIEFAKKDSQPGNNFNQPVILGHEHGITFASSEDDAFNLLPAKAGAIQNATIKGSPAVMRSVLGLVAASRAAQGGKQSFMDATKFLVANMMRSMAKKIEIEMLYGQMGYGTVASVSVATITITTSEWAPGIWAGAEKMPVEIRDSTGATIRGSADVQSVSLENRTITLSAAIPGIVAGDVIWHGGAYGNEFAGIHKILTQTTGTLFGINVASYNLFKGNEYAVGSAPLSFTKLQNAVARAVEKGQDGTLFCLVNPRGWANMLNDQASLRMYDQSYSKQKAENGSEKLLFHSQNGQIEIEPSIYVKEGYGYMLSLEDWSRVGSSDMTFNRPGQGDQFFRDQENSAGYELRLYTDQALFCSAPGRNVLLSGIVNSN